MQDSNIKTSEINVDERPMKNFKLYHDSKNLKMTNSQPLFLKKHEDRPSQGNLRKESQIPSVVSDYSKTSQN